MLDKHFVILGAMLSLFGALRYVRDTLHGQTKPNRVTWFCWSLAPLIAFAAEVKQGIGLQALMTFMVGFNPLLVFIASFVNRKAYWKLTKLDITCGLFSILALILWKITGTGNIAIALSIAADGLAAIPTIRKTYLHPDTESHTTFLFGAASAAITLLTIKHWTFAIAGFPIYILVTCLLIFGVGEWGGWYRLHFATKN